MDGVVAAADQSDFCVGDLPAVHTLFQVLEHAGFDVVLVPVKNLLFLDGGFVLNAASPGQRLDFQLHLCPAGLGPGIAFVADSLMGRRFLVNHRGLGEGGFQPEPLGNQFFQHLQLDDPGDFNVQLPFLRQPQQIQKGVLVGKLAQGFYQCRKLLCLFRVNLHLQKGGGNGTGPVYRFRPDNISCFDFGKAVNHSDIPGGDFPNVLGLFPHAAADLGDLFRLLLPENRNRVPVLELPAQQPDVGGFAHNRVVLHLVDQPGQGRVRVLGSRGQQGNHAVQKLPASHPCFGGAEKYRRDLPGGHRPLQAVLQFRQGRLFFI